MRGGVGYLTWVERMREGEVVRLQLRGCRGFPVVGMTSETGGRVRGWEERLDNTPDPLSSGCWQ